MQDVLKGLYDSTQAYFDSYKKALHSEDETAYSRFYKEHDNDEYLWESLRLVFKRGVLADIWEQSKNDMSVERETLGLLRGHPERAKDPSKYEYHIDSCKRITSGISKQELEKKIGCLAMFLGGAADPTSAKPFLKNNVGMYHTHPLISMLKFQSFEISERKLGVVPRESDQDRRIYEDLTKKVSHSSGNEYTMLPFLVTTSYAEGKVLWDILFNSILTHYSNNTPSEIKKTIFEVNGTNRGSSYMRSTDKLEQAFLAFYDYATLGDTKKVIDLSNMFLLDLKEKGYTKESKLWGKDVNKIVEWTKSPLIWDIAKEDYLLSDHCSSAAVHLKRIDGKEFVYDYPMYDSKGISLNGPYMPKQVAVEYRGDFPQSVAVSDFKRMYQRKFGREFLGLLGQINKYSSGHIPQIRVTQECREVFGFMDSGEVGFEYALESERKKRQE